MNALIASCENSPQEAMSVFFKSIREVVQRYSSPSFSASNLKSFKTFPSKEKYLGP